MYVEITSPGFQLYSHSGNSLISLPSLLSLGEAGPFNVPGLSSIFQNVFHSVKKTGIQMLAEAGMSGLANVTSSPHPESSALGLNKSSHVLFVVPLKCQTYFSLSQGPLIPFLVLELVNSNYIFVFPASLV